MTDPLNVSNLITNYTFAQPGSKTILTAEDLITQYCYELDRNLMWFLGFLVFLWFAKYALNQYLKWVYLKKKRDIPSLLSSAYLLMSETLDLLQSTFILVLFVLLMWYV